MKKLRPYIYSTVLALISTYASFAFIQWEWSACGWGIHERAFFLFCFGMCAVIYAYIYYNITDDQ